MRARRLRCMARLKCVLAVLAVQAVQAGCGRNDAEHRVLTPSSPSLAPEEAAPVVDARAAAPAPPAAPLTLSVSLRAVSGGLGLAVRNTGAEAVSLRSAVSLERNGQLVLANALSLQATCAPETCVTLLPGTEYLAPRWLDLPSAERCGTLLQAQAPGSLLRIKDCRGERSQEVLLP